MTIYFVDTFVYRDIPTLWIVVTLIQRLKRVLQDIDNEQKTQSLLCFIISLNGLIWIILITHVTETGIGIINIKKYTDNVRGALNVLIVIVLKGLMSKKLFVFARLYA